MGVILDLQTEILNESGHQDWHRVIVRDFGGGVVEASVMPYETWSEPSDQALKPIEKAKRGEGDRVRSIEESSRRARRKVRHLCKSLKARYMVTLTTKEAIKDAERFNKLFKEFVRRIRTVKDFQYVATLEKHDSDDTTPEKVGSYHIHIGVSTRQDYKLLWSVWYAVVGEGQGRVHVSKGFQAQSMGKIAGYLSKYITKSFESGELNKRRYWASKCINEAVRTVHLLRPDWSMTEVIKYVYAFLHDINTNVTNLWLDYEKGLLWLSAERLR